MKNPQPNAASRLLRTRSGPAFTLIELLASIGIIAVLMVLLIPSLKSARLSAKKVACLSNLRQLSTAFISYRTDHQQLFPGQGPSNDATQRWMQKVSPYLGIAESTVQNHNLAYFQSIFYCPMVPSSVHAPNSSKAGCGVYGATRSVVTLGTDTGLSYFRVVKPSTKVLLGDKSYLSYQGYGGAGPGFGQVTAPFPNDADGPAANHRPDGNPLAGPDGACNYLFCDGHVETLTKWPGVNAFNATVQ